MQNKKSETDYKVGLKNLEVEDNSKLAWSYRQDAVCPNQIWLFNQKNILCGAPHGSVLRPLLFINFINKIQELPRRK